MTGTFQTIYIAPNGDVYQAELGVIEDAHLGIVADVGVLSGSVTFRFPGSGQGTGGHCLDGKPTETNGPRVPDKACGAWVAALLAAVGVDDFSKVRGSTAFALCKSDGDGSNRRILGIVGMGGQAPMIFAEVFA